MPKRKGVSAAAWFYSQPGFHAPSPLTPREERIVNALCVVNGVHTGICETCAAVAERGEEKAGE